MKKIQKKVYNYLHGGNIPPSIKIAIKILATHYKTYLVGGTIRDIILNRIPNDIDIATKALPEQVIKIYKDFKNLRVIPSGINHGTVTIICKDTAESMEITTFRKDVSCDGRNATIEFAKTIEEDLSRRDFTMNSIAYDVESPEISIIDPFNGIRDIKRKLIKTVGDPNGRFVEDFLRILRACRFASSLNFKIHPKTLFSMTNLLKIEKYVQIIQKKVSFERVRDELLKMMKANKPSISIELMRKCGILNIYIPELLEGYGVKQNIYHQFTIYKHLLGACDACESRDPILRLAALFHDIGKFRTIGDRPDGTGHSFHRHEMIGAEMVSKIMRRLKFSRKDTERVSLLVSSHMFNDKNMKKPAIRRFVNKVGIDNVDDLFVLRKADREGSGKGAWGFKLGYGKSVERMKKKIDQMIVENNALKITDLHIDGQDLIDSFSLIPGPIFKEIFNYLMERVLNDPELNDKPTLLSMASDYLSNNKEY